MTKTPDHLYIFLTIAFTVYSQLIMRWQVLAAGPLPADIEGKLNYVGHLLLNPWVLSGVVATFFAGISWMLAMTKFEISYAFPFVSLTYVLVLAAGAFVFKETFSLIKIFGTVLIVAGLIVISKG